MTASRILHLTKIALLFVSCLCVLPIAAWAAEPPVTSVAFTPDGKSAICGSQRGLVLYDWPQLDEVRTLETAATNIHDLAFSPDGRMLAVAGGDPAESGFVELFAWPDGNSLGRLAGAADSVVSIQWKDNQTIIGSSLDRSVLSWNVETKQVTRKLTGHSRGVTAVAYLPQQDTVVSAGLDDTLRVWNRTDGTLIRSLNNHTAEIHELAVRPGSDALPMVASVSTDRTLRLWQPTIGRMVRFVRLESTPLCVTWLPDGNRAAVGCDDGTIRLVDPQTAQITGEFPALSGWIYTAAAHPKDGSLLVGGQGGKLSRVVVPR